MDSVEVDEVKQATARANWWDGEDFPFSAPWWFRYPLGAVALVAAYYAFGLDGLNTVGRWVGGALLALIGIGLVRELFFGVLAVILFGFLLWAVLAGAAAQPIPTAIIVGAIIIAFANKSR